MMLTGRVYSATEGSAYGFTQHSTEAGGALPKAMELAERAAANAPLTNFAVLQVPPTHGGQSANRPAGWNRRWRRWCKAIKRPSAWKNALKALCQQGRQEQQEALYKGAKPEDGLWVEDKWRKRRRPIMGLRPHFRAVKLEKPKSTRPDDGTIYLTVENAFRSIPIPIASPTACTIGRKQRPIRSSCGSATTRASGARSATSALQYARLDRRGAAGTRSLRRAADRDPVRQFGIEHGLLAIAVRSRRHSLRGRFRRPIR